ncbi:MAG: sulfite exporter TauE/SafE family protein [Porticoccaceae bacterium]
MPIDWLLICAGAVTGLLVGLTGVGGGALMTPLLLLLFGVAPLAAVGTDLWFAAVTKMVATRVHHGYGLIDWSVAKRLWLGSLPASLATLAWVHLHPPTDATVGLLKTAIAAAVILTALGLLLQHRLHALGRRLRTTDDVHFKAVQPPLTILSGALLGALVTLTSVGAGALGVVFLAYIYPLRLTPPRLIATDITHAIPLAIFAGSGHLWLGNVDFHLLGNLLAGSLPAVLLGARLSARLPHGLLRRLLAVVLLAIGAKLAWSVSAG